MPEAERPADPLSIISLASGIAALLLAVFSVLPFAAMCTMPFSVLSVLTSIVTGIVSLVRTSVRPELEGRWQALAGLGLSLLWCGAAGVLMMFVLRAH